LPAPGRSVRRPAAGTGSRSGPSDRGPTLKRILGEGDVEMVVREDREAFELLLIEEADAWFEYADATKGQFGNRYAEIEPWAWARLQQRLRAVRARRARLDPATEAA
jgi:hypothetical protein